MDERDRFIARALRRYRLGVAAGHAEALADAVRFCSHMAVPPPPWLAEALRRPAAKRGRGRPPADATDFMRFNMVQECRERRGDLGVPATWDAAFAAISEELRGTAHAGSAEAIRASYKRVLKRMRANPGRYYIKDLG